MRKHAGIAIIIATVLILVGCSESKDKQQQANQGGEEQQPAKPVDILTISSQAIASSELLPGRVEPFSVAEIRPQVNGIIQSMYFEQGSFVEKGEQLFQIDPSTYEAQVDVAKANVKDAKAQLEVTQALENRLADLVKTNAVSEQEYENAQADTKQANAAVSLAEAQLSAAEVDLEFTRVYAPISGYIGPSSVTKGALVTAQQAETLATIRQLDPIYVDITQSASDLTEIRQALIAAQALSYNRDQNENQSNVDATNNSQFAVEIFLQDGSEKYSHEGTLYATDLAVDESTSTVQLRAIVPNPDGELIPGMFIRARVQDTSQTTAILVPQKAVSIDEQGNKSVWLVADDNTVSPREIVTSGTHENQWIVSEGLVENDRVVVDGTMMLKPGTKVKDSSANKKSDNESSAS